MMNFINLNLKNIAQDQKIKLYNAKLKKMEVSIKKTFYN